MVTASNGYEESWSNKYGSRLQDRLKRAVMGADTNGDGTVVMRELEAFLKTTYSEKIYTVYGTYVYMHPQVYPTNSSFPIFKKR